MFESITVVSGQTDQFWGFVATAGESITSIVSVYVASDTFGVDNIEIVATSVPEPGTLALLAIGIAGLGLVRRKKN